MILLQRFRDWRHERYIAHLGVRCKLAYALGDRIKARVYWWLLTGAIQRRSAAQVVRMERRMGLHPRTAIKRGLMHSFLHGRIPSILVTTIFRLLRLRSL